MGKSKRATPILLRKQHVIDGPRHVPATGGEPILRPLIRLRLTPLGFYFCALRDRRCRVWMKQDVEAAQESDDFFKLKMIHARLNQGKLENALKKREDKLDKNFLDRRIFAGVGPWPIYVPS